jgi:hypothetical protein
MADLIEEGATRATAFEYLEQELEGVVSILTPAIQQGLSESAASLDFEDFKNGLTSNLQEQMKMAVVAAAQQDFMESIISSAFDEVGNIQDLLGDYFSGDLTLDEFTTEFDLAMNKIEDALSTEEFDRFRSVLEALGFTVEDTTEKTAQAVAELNSQLNSIAQQRAKMFDDPSYKKSYYERTYGFMPSKETIKTQWDYAMSATDEAILEWAEELGVDAGTYLTDLGEAYDYYFGEVEIGTQIMNSATSSASNYNSALREQASLLQNQISNYQSIQGVIDSIMGGEQMGPTSAAFMERRYSELLAGAQENPEQIGAFTSFVQSKFLPFMQQYGGNYGGVEESVLEDLFGLREDVAGEKTLTDLYNEFARVNEELAKITQNTGATVTAVQSIPSSGGGFTMPGQDATALNRSINPIIAARDEVGSIGDLRRMYSQVLYEGTLDPVLRQLAADIDLPMNTILGDLRSYYGFADGGTIYGPASGYTVPTTFHGIEHITPDREMKEVKSLLRELVSMSGRGGNADGGQVIVNVFMDGEQMAPHTVEVLRTNPEAQHQVRRIAANG